MTQRHEIERTFHDQWAQGIDIESLMLSESFEAETALENSYALSCIEPVAGKKLLDIGCGAGETSVYMAMRGADVTASDISGEMLKVAEQLAAHHGAKLRTQQCVAEQLPFADGEFDIVFGNGILHHVEVEQAVKEIKRVLKVGGKAVFIEPLAYNPAIWAYRIFASGVRTPTEKPFYWKQFRTIEDIFGNLHHREFWFTTLSVFLYFFFIERQNPSKVRYWKKVIEDADRIKWLFSPLKNLDDKLLKAMPWLGPFCWNTVILVKKELP